MYSLYFRESLGLGEEFYNAAYSVATLLSAVTISIIGPYLDRTTSLRGTQYIASGLIVACLLMSFAHWVWMWCLCLYFVRLAGQGMMGLTAQTAMIRWFRKNRGKALGLTSIGFSIGEIIFPVIMPPLIVYVGWRASWWVVAAMIFVAVILQIPRIANRTDTIVDDGATQPSRDNAGKSEVSHQGELGGPAFTRGMILKDIRFYLFMPSLMVLPMVATGLIWNQSGIAEWRGWEPSWMIRSFIGFGIGRLVFSLIAGPLVDRYSAVRMYLIFLIPVAVAVSLPIISSAMWVPWALYLLLGLGQGFAGVTGSALWPELYGTRHIAAIKSFSNTFAVFSTALGPGLISLLLKFGNSYEAVLYAFFTITIVFWLLGLAGVIVHNKSKPTHQTS